LKAYFEELVPDYDEERVYVSDIKKVIQWYNQLHQHDLLEVIEKEEEEKESDDQTGDKEKSDSGKNNSPASDKSGQKDSI